MSPESDPSVRLAALERQVAVLSAEVAELRGAREARRAAPPPPAEPVSELRQIQVAAERLYHRAAASAGPSFSGDAIESFVGRYGMLLLAALAILMAVGVLVEVAVARGLLTPAVRVGLGALVAAVVGGAGLWFRRRGEVRYGDVLLSIALAIVDLVAWAAGPRLQVIPPLVALAVVDVVSIGIAYLALHDENEFLFAVAVGGALSAPFVTSDGGGSALALLSYGGVVIVGAVRLVRDPDWRRAFAVMVGGAAIYMLAVAAMPAGPAWHEPLLIAIFGGACALAALLTAQLEWRGDLARSFIAATVVGSMVAWDRSAAQPGIQAVLVATVLAVVTYASLWVRQPPPAFWVGSALVLPLVSLGLAYPVAESTVGGWVALSVWSLYALASWWGERGRAEAERAGAHLLAAGMLGSLAIGALLWDHPLPLVAALGAWGTVLAAIAAREQSPLPLAAVALTLFAGGASAIDQLASRVPYGYTPFVTRSSASAACAALALAASAELIARLEASGAEGVRTWADRPLRLGLVTAFLIVWGRMELAHAFSRDLSTFLLILYYAACGLATIVAGRRLAVQRLRMAGLALSVYAAVKAMVEVSAIEGVLLRVASYGAVGLFLLGAGYLYRVRRPVAPDEASALSRPPLSQV